MWQNFNPFLCHAFCLDRSEAELQNVNILHRENLFTNNEKIVASMAVLRRNFYVF